MPHTDLFNLPDRGVLMGIDPGGQTLGVAVSDGLRIIASPVEVIRRSGSASAVFERLFRLYEKYDCAGMIAGLPLNMDGSNGPQSQSARALARSILQWRDIPLAYQDERLTSRQAERAMLDADMSRTRRAGIIDASAAAIILQTALDRMANQ